jgi:protein gp37
VSATKTTIEWTDATWNPVRGCVKVSPGCKHCYAATFAERWRGVEGHPYEQGFDPRLVPEKLREPLRWRAPRRVFVNSMSDLFGEFVPDDYIDQVFGVMHACEYRAIPKSEDVFPWHTFQILTKRASRMREYLATDRRREWARTAGRCALEGSSDRMHDYVAFREAPAPHIHLGVSVEDRKYGVPRIDVLREVPAALRFLSVEPLLEDLGEINLTGIGWVIVGAESGRGARPMREDWVRSLRDQCAAAGVPFFYKQKLDERGRKVSLPLLDGAQHAAFPGGAR